MITARDPQIDEQIDLDLMLAEAGKELGVVRAKFRPVSSGDGRVGQLLQTNENIIPILAPCIPEIVSQCTRSS